MRQKSGFALPLVLGMVVVLALTLGVTVTSLQGLNEQTRLARDGAAFEVAAATAEARLQYLMVTEPFGAASIDIGASRRLGPQGQGEAQTPPDEQLFLNGRPYVFRNAPEVIDAPAYLLEVQDEAGLVNLYQMDVLQLQRLFEWAGLESRDAENLANELVAYNADPTLHQPMRRPAELYRLDGAKELITDRVWRRLADIVTSYPDNRAVNINTASPEALRIWFDLTEERAQDIVADRDLRDDDAPLTSLADIGVVVAVNQNFAFTGGRLRFYFSDPATGLSYQSSLIFTPNSATRPVWTENPQTLKLPEIPVLPEEPQDFPQIPDLAS
jgi:hypothetical protein